VSRRYIGYLLVHTIGTPENRSTLHVPNSPRKKALCATVLSYTAAGPLPTARASEADRRLIESYTGQPLTRAYFVRVSRSMEGRAYVEEVLCGPQGPPRGELSA